MELGQGHPRLISRTEVERGVLAGLWIVPLAGFRWRNDLRPMPARLMSAEDWDRPPDDLGPWLVPDDSQGGRRYPIFRPAALLDDFEGLGGEPSPAAIVRFADRFGALGVERWLREENGKRNPDGGTVYDTSNTSFGESLATWRQESGVFRDLRRTWRAVTTLDEADSYGPSRLREAGNTLRSRIQWNDKGFVHYRTESGAWKVITDPLAPDRAEVLARFRRDDPRGPARYHIFREVNERLQGRVRPVVDADRRTLRFWPESLLAAMYLRFAGELIGARGPERECERCHEVFLVRRRDMRFCGKNCREAASYQRRRLEQSAQDAASS